MSIITNNVTCPSVPFGQPSPPVAAGGEGKGFRVEPDPKHVYPQSVFPVTVRAWLNDDTYREHVMHDRRTRWPSEGFKKLEVQGPSSTKWLVTVYTTLNDWDEPDTAPQQLATFRDSNPYGGEVLRVLNQVYRPGPGLTTQPATPAGVLHNAMAPAAGGGEQSAVLRLDASGRLRVVVEGGAGAGGAVLLESGTLNVRGNPQASESLGAARDTSAYRTLWLRCGAVRLIAGDTRPTVQTADTTPAAQLVLRALGAGDVLLGDIVGPVLTNGAAGELQVGQNVSGAAGNVRAVPMRLLRAQPRVNISGTPTGYVVPWELWGEP